MKKIIFGILLHVVVKMENGKYLAGIIGNSLITLDEIIDVEAKSNDKEITQVPTNLNEKK